MACIVYGFPSKIAALQFEWAWQNTHLTRHIAADDRISRMGTKTKYSPRTGRKITKVTRPRMSLNDRLVNLHILLSAQSFHRWPLSVRFHASDVFKAWQKVVGARDKLPMSSSDVTLDIPAAQDLAVTDERSEKDAAATEVPKSGIYAHDYSYQPFKASLEHSLKMLGDGDTICAQCCSTILADSDLAIVCPKEQCSGVFHLKCLGDRVLSVEEEVIPSRTVSCPKCLQNWRWLDLARDLSLRSRGLKEQALLFKQKRGKKGVKDAAADLLQAMSDLSDDPEQSNEDVDVVEEALVKPKKRRVAKRPRDRTESEHGRREIEGTTLAGSGIAKPMRQKAKSDARISSVPGSFQDDDWSKVPQIG